MLEVVMFVSTVAVAVPAERIGAAVQFGTAPKIPELTAHV